MLGRVVALFGTHGFIENNEGVSHYFNPQQMSEGAPFKSMEVGSEVKFSSRPGVRGMRACFVEHADKIKHPIVLDPDALYAERIGKSRRITRDGEPPALFEHHRLHSVVRMRSPGHLDAEQGFQAFLKAVHVAGANMVFDPKVTAIERDIDGIALTAYEWQASVGIYVALKKVESQQELAEVNLDTEENIQQRLSQLKALQDGIDQERSRGVPFTARSVVCEVKAAAQPEKRVAEDGPSLS
jgi:hypothetical protein